MTDEFMNTVGLITTDHVHMELFRLKSGFIVKAIFTDDSESVYDAATFSEALKKATEVAMMAEKTSVKEIYIG